MVPTKKHVLKAAKQNMADEINKKIENFVKAHERLEGLRDQCELDTREWESYTQQMCKCNEAKHALQHELEELLKPKTRKQVVKSSLEWKQDRKDMRAKVKEAEKVTIRDNDALRRVRDAEFSRKQLGFGDWLAEGALVRQRGTSNPLLVISPVHNGLVDCLDGAFQRKYRAKALRPLNMDE